MSRKTPTEIADDLQQRIWRGEWSTGSALPLARELAIDLNVSHSTVDRAYRHLHLRGLTEARRGQGTFVRDATGRDRLRLLLKMQHDHRGYYVQIKDCDEQDVRFSLLEPHLGVQLGTVPPDVARLLDVDPLSPAVIRNRVLGWKRGSEQAPTRDLPMMWSVSYLPEHIVTRVPAVRDQSPGPGGIYARIEETLGGPLRWDGQVETEIATEQTANTLSLSRPASVLRLFRITIGLDGRPVEVLDQRVDGSKFRVAYEIPRGESATLPIDPRHAG